MFPSPSLYVDSSWKTKLRRDIDEAIKAVNTYEDFLDLIRANGYEIKGETFGEKAYKYIYFRPLDRESSLTHRKKSSKTAPA